MLRALLPVVLVASACTPTSTLSFSNVPTPVLLGPVSRVGGDKGDASSLGAPFEVRVERSFLVASNKGNTRGVSVLDDDAKASFAALQATSARRDTDVRVSEILAGAWYFWLWTSVGNAAWLEARGQTQGSRP